MTLNRIVFRAMLSLMLLGNSIAFANAEKDDEIAWTIGGSENIRDGEDKKDSTPPPAPEQPDGNDLNSSETPKAAPQPTWNDCAKLYLSDNLNLVYAATGMLAVVVVAILVRGMNHVQANVVPGHGIHNVAGEHRVKAEGREVLEAMGLRVASKITANWDAYVAAVITRLNNLHLALPEAAVLHDWLRQVRR